MKHYKNTLNLMPISLGITAILITATGIFFKQSFFNILPLYISLFISFMQSKVNRKAYLLGAGNSILYMLVYVHFKLYASAAYAILFSCTIQLVTYFLWGQKPVGKATVFRAMKGWQRGILGVGFAVAWGICWVVLSFADSNYQIFDISISLLGIVASIMTMLAFIEYVPLMIIMQFLNIGLYLRMMFENPAQITYLIYTLFSLQCQFLALKKVLLLYKEQCVDA